MKNIHGKIGKIHNVGSGISTTILELAQLLLKISRKDLQIIHKPALEGDIVFSQTSIEQIITDLGFIPKISLEKRLEAFLTNLAFS